MILMEPNVLHGVQGDPSMCGLRFKTEMAN